MGGEKTENVPMSWMYILRCADGSYYVGSTTDLQRRIVEHNDGIGAQYTARRRPVHRSSPPGGAGLQRRVP